MHRHSEGSGDVSDSQASDSSRRRWEGRRAGRTGKQSVGKEEGGALFSLTGSRDEGDEPLCGEVGPLDEGLLGEALVVEVVDGGAQVAAKVHHAAPDQEPQRIKELEGLWNGRGLGDGRGRDWGTGGIRMLISRISVRVVMLGGNEGETPFAGGSAAFEEGKGGTAMPLSLRRGPNHPEPVPVPTVPLGRASGSWRRW